MVTKKQADKPESVAGNATFWQKLPKPFFVLAPMANVTDSAFRKIIAKYGKPDVMWTEFVSADGLISAGKKNLMSDLQFSNTERPIVTQLFTGHPKVMRKAAALVAKLGFDGLDINMGCPDRAIERQGGGAALMKDQKLAIEVLRAAREGVKDSTTTGGSRGGKIIPVSVKTRIGYNKVDMEWLRLLLSHRLPILTVHLRTRKEMSDVPAHWELMPGIIKLRDEICAKERIEPKTLIIGNGDVESIEDGLKKAKETGCDGIMIGRGIFGKPWLFRQAHKSVKKVDTLPDRQKGMISPAYRLKVMVEHTKLYEKLFITGKGLKKPVKSFDVMKKHFKAYVSGWDGAKELRVKLMDTHSAKEVEGIVKEYLGG